MHSFLLKSKKKKKKRKENPKIQNPSAAERNLKQERVLQEELNNSQSTDGETCSHEAEEAPSAMKAPQVANSLLHYLASVIRFNC